MKFFDHITFFVDEVLPVDSDNDIVDYEDEVLCSEEEDEEFPEAGAEEGAAKAAEVHDIPGDAVTLVSITECKMCLRETK